ncbi:bifunctional folylpolyglutamate synthase/dihydrofolate synthase [Pseudonocardia sp. C8]|uniref:bifunctional folylpolyglutamate synthase/dihydrofolate synthase n=1 Tax=Pseudonocardia sp. C8 TaxID=2762759 RepID=UPI001642B9CC|nr:bifunctional folylpolyglutamate synthase/dihydrofolate synthase [Pseudonocardia sp. C8]
MTAPATGVAGPGEDVDGFLLGLPASGRGAGAPATAPQERAREILAELGDPQERVRTVHVAGTAGKGSVCAFVAALLAEHGFRVGTQTSPHVYSVRERFMVGGQPVDEAVVREHLARVRAAVGTVERRRAERCAFFEVVTALGFSIAAERAHYAVVETGIGGRLDPTNVVARPDKLAVVTRIGLDHVDILGDSPGRIAAEKSGILPVGGDAVAAVNGPEADAALVERARERGTRLEFVDTDAAAAVARTGPSGTRVDLAGWADVPLGLHGRHQAGNAVLALHAVATLAQRDGWSLDPLAVRNGLARTHIPGRFEQRSVRGRAVVLDGAHDPVKLSALAETVGDRYPDRAVTWVLALARDKDLDASVQAVAPGAGRIVATELPAGPAGGHRPAVWSAAEIAAAARRAGVEAVAEPDPRRAREHALRTGDPTSAVVVTGSFRLLAVVDDPAPG